MYKQVMLLGLLIGQPMYGQQIREFIEEHHDLLANHIKKPTIYYQLERLAVQGYLEIRRETVEAPGPGAAHDELALRERDVYHITPAGRRHLLKLLRNMLGRNQTTVNEIDVCLYFLQYLPKEEACGLLQERLKGIEQEYTNIQAFLKEIQKLDAHHFIYEHKMVLLQAEIGWLQQMITHLQSSTINSQFLNGS